MYQANIACYSLLPLTLSYLVDLGAVGLVDGPVHAEGVGVGQSGVTGVQRRVARMAGWRAIAALERLLGPRPARRITASL